MSSGLFSGGTISMDEEEKGEDNGGVVTRRDVTDASHVHRARVLYRVI
jgi:hypothetical protein